MFRLFLYCFIFLCAFCVYSCNKDAAVAHAKLSPRAMLTAHPWKIKKLLYREEGDSTNSDFTTFVYKSCELDDLYIFGTDSSFEREDNTDVCSFSGTFGLWGKAVWSGNGDLTKLSIMSLSYLINFNVLGVNDTSLILEEPARDYLGNDIVYTHEFKPE